jgi:hypothetical protein
VFVLYPVTLSHFHPPILHSSTHHPLSPTFWIQNNENAPFQAKIGPEKKSKSAFFQKSANSAKFRGIFGFYCNYFLFTHFRHSYLTAWGLGKIPALKIFSASFSPPSPALKIFSPYLPNHLYSCGFPGIGGFRTGRVTDRRQFQVQMR